MRSIPREIAVLKYNQRKRAKKYSRSEQRINRIVEDIQKNFLQTIKRGITQYSEKFRFHNEKTALQVADKLETLEDSICWNVDVNILTQKHVDIVVEWKLTST